ncbi:MAG: cytochrome-c oxidase, cbb3-type subunit III [Burkholderiales bacterium]|nr:MAG: cytochrome-c oxidase, cbb3-type subunit III [Burkholderiales bacterium]
MTDHSPEIDPHTGVETTGHQWDGIKELNNPLPRWWLFVFWASVVVAVGYWILMPSWPAPPGLQGYASGTLQQSDRSDVAAETAAMRRERNVLSARLAAVDASSILRDHDLSQLAMSLGESAFGDNCATCHGAGGRGAKGFPQLADDVWLWGGKLEDIERTIRYGIRSAHAETRTSEMPAFGRDEFLQPAQIEDLVQLVRRASGQKADAEAAARAQPVFEANCASCHGVDLQGDRSKGAPNLTDKDWIYGGDPASIRRTIYGPRNGVMPAWVDRLDPATIRALAIYVHSLGGGE